MDQKPKIILLAGPTASGKSKLAIKLSKVLNGEIVNADSMQVYKEFKFLTARPTFKQQKNIKHHFQTMMVFGKKREKELIGSNLIQKLKM